MSHPYRREVLKWTSAGMLLSAFGIPAFGQGVTPGKPGGLLEKAQKAGSVKIGVVNAPPYSGLNPDGTVSGIATMVCEAVLKRLGIPKMEVSIAPYSQQIPGLLAGRWDIITSSLTITKERCLQIRYTDPVTYDGGAIAYISSKMSPPPNSLAEIGKQKLTVGLTSGSYIIQKATELGLSRSNMQIFEDNTSLIDGLEAGRVQLAISPSLRHMRAARKNSYDIVFPITDDVPHGSAPAFRNEDTEFYEAFQRELRAVKASGEFERIAALSSYAVDPKLLKLTADEACKAA